MVGIFPSNVLQFEIEVKPDVVGCQFFVLLIDLHQTKRELKDNGNVWEHILSFKSMPFFEKFHTRAPNT